MAPTTIPSVHPHLAPRGIVDIASSNTTEYSPSIVNSFLSTQNGATAFVLVVIWAAVVTVFGLLYLSYKVNMAYYTWRFDGGRVHHTRWYRTLRSSTSRRRFPSRRTRRWIEERREDMRRWFQERREDVRQWKDRRRQGMVELWRRVRGITVLEGTEPQTNERHWTELPVDWTTLTINWTMPVTLHMSHSVPFYNLGSRPTHF